MMCVCEHASCVLHVEEEGLYMYISVTVCVCVCMCVVGGGGGARTYILHGHMFYVKKNVYNHDRRPVYA